MSYLVEDSDGHAELFRERRPVARKPHKCHACGETIRSGDRYARVFFVWEGEPDTVKRCMRCEKIHAHLVDRGNGDTYPAERLDCGESYQDHWGEDPPDEIAALAFALPGEVRDV